MTSEQLAWLAGLLEGEGCFGVHRSRPSSSPRASIQLNMNDEDVIDRVVEITGLGKKLGPYQYKKHHLNPFWSWRLRGEIAETLMKTMKPYMGKRRSAKIEEVLLLVA